MPEMDGVEATRRIRALPAPKCDVPILVLTAHAMAGAKEHYLDAGMDDYVSKPIQPALLLSKLADLSLALKPRARTARPAIARVAETPPSGPGQAAALPPQRPPLDLEQLRGLVEVLPPEGLREFIGMYLDQVDETLGRIGALAARGDLPALGREAHAIISTAGNVGAAEMSALARALEDACRAGNRAAAAELTRRVIAASATASTALRQWLEAFLAEQSVAEAVA